MKFLTYPSFNKQVLCALVWCMPMLMARPTYHHAVALTTAKQVPYTTRLIAHWNTHFKKEEAKIMGKFYQLSKMTPAQWQEWKDSCRSPFARFEQGFKTHLLAKSPAPDRTIRALVKKLLVKHAMPHIDIAPDPDWCMAAYDTFITINSEQLYNDNWLEHGVLHEIQHLKNKDYFTGYCFCVWFENYRDIVNEQTAHEFLTEFNHFKELRAEILALCSRSQKSQEAHLAYLHQYQSDHFGSRNYHDATFNHPSSGVFYDHLKKLCSSLRTLA